MLKKSTVVYLRSIIPSDHHQITQLNVVSSRESNKTIRNMLILNARDATLIDGTSKYITALLTASTTLPTFCAVIYGNAEQNYSSLSI